MIGPRRQPITHARRMLLRRDPVLAALIRQQGPCGLAAQRADHFSALVRAITFQQLSTKAASTIYNRMVALMPDAVPTPEGFAALSDDRLRGAGMSRQKIGYLRDLCEKVSAGNSISTARGAQRRRGDRCPRDDQRDRPVVGRDVPDLPPAGPDVLPVGDLGILTAVQRAYRLRKRPTPERLRKIGEAWRHTARSPREYCGAASTTRRW